MMMILAQNLPDISGVEASFVKSWWIMAGFVFVIVVQVYNTWLTKKGQSHQITGRVETVPGKEAADKKEHDDLKKSVDALRAEVTAQFNAAQRAGEARVAAIAQDIDEQMGVVSERIGTLAEALHEKINKALVDNSAQGEAINNLKAGQSMHQTEIANIRNRIADLLAAGRKRPSP